MNSCWHNREAVDEINAAYKGYLSTLSQTPHISVLMDLIRTATARYGKGLKVLDIGCGTGLVARFFKDHHYTGADLPHMIEHCAQVNNPGYSYRCMDWDSLTDYSFLKEYDLILVNAFIDVLKDPIHALTVLLQSGKPIILHRQEISMNFQTHVSVNGSYGKETYHSVINYKAFNKLLNTYDYGIMDQGNNHFDNWENGGHSFLLEHQPSWALHKADHALVKLFGGKRNGTYIEAGANDGIRQSNTMLLYSNYSWRGILIEPVPEVFERLKHNRPGDFCVHAALVEPNYGNDQCIIEYTPECYGLMSAMKGMPFTKERLEKAGEEGIGVWAPARTLDQIIEQYEPREIDLLCLDIEGYELKALQGIDLEKWKPQYLMIEQLDKSNTEIETYLSPWYTRVDLFGENDVIYKRK